jgi:myo-inositol-1(or 4)-monophosphatase
MRVVAVNVALRQAANLICAAVADPFSGEVFWTDGRAAQVRVDAHDMPLSPDPASKLVELNFDPPFPNAPGFRTVALAADPEFALTFRPRVVSSSLALTWVAAGRRAAYVTDGDIRDSVHFSAGLAICQDAGCVITDLHGDACGQGPGGVMVAADRETHATLLRLARTQNR